MVTLLILLAGLPISLYLAMSLPPVQEKLRQMGQDELSRILDSPVSIDKVYITPFSQVEISGITVTDIYGDTALSIDKLGAGVSMRRLLLNHRLVINYVEILGPDIRIYRPSANQQLNIARILDALKSKDPQKPASLFDLRVNMVVLRRGRISYDTDSAVTATDGNFNPNHIHITDLKADVSLPRVKNNDFIINLKRLSFKEDRGFCLNDLHASTILSDSLFAVNDLRLSLPSSMIGFSDISIPLDSIQALANTIKSSPLHIAILPESHIYLPDLAPFIPVLGNVPSQLDLYTRLSGTLDNISVEQLMMSMDDGHTYISCNGSIDSISSRHGRSINLSHVDIRTHGVKIDSLISVFTKLDSKQSALVQRLGNIGLNGSAHLSELRQNFTGTVHTTPGDININASLSRHNTSSPKAITGIVNSNSLDIKQIMPDGDLGKVSFGIAADAYLGRKTRKGHIDCNVQQVEWKGNMYSDLAATLECENDTFIVSTDFNDPSLTVQADGMGIIGKEQSIDLNANILSLNSSLLGLQDKYPDYKLSGKINAEASGQSFDYADGSIMVTDIRFVNTEGKGLNLSPIDISIHNSTEPQHMSLSAGNINGHLEGSYSYSTIVKTMKEIVGKVFPAALYDYQTTEMADNDIAEPTGYGNKAETTENSQDQRTNNFSYELTLTDNPQLAEFFHLPFRILYPVHVTGKLNHADNSMKILVDAPYLQQKDKLIRNTRLRVSVEGNEDMAQLSATTTMPSKYGEVSLNLDCSGASNRLDTKLTWLIDAKRAFNGTVDLSASLARNPQNELISHLSVNPSQLIFNDSVWTINKADVYALPQRISVDHFSIARKGQSLTIDGVASADSTDAVTIKLNNIDLDYVFSTLGIDNVMFGGIATGNFYGNALMSANPVLYTPKLSVKKLKYNGSVMGDTNILSAWHNDTRGISIDAIINQENGSQSQINGVIYPFTEELDFHFKADKVAVGFMQPFMSAFADNVSGYASGNAHLYGTFKYLDMTGDLYADDFSLKLAFTNTTYWASDSIRLRPGSITIDNLKIKDKYGHTAMLNGWVSHKFFKEPEFDFSLTRAENLLSYDVDQSTEHPWYGRIFGNGSAFLNGKPGVVNIGVNMASAPGSTFTFVLSDAEIADEYSFISFRDRNAVTITDTFGLKVGSAELDRLMHERVRKNQEAMSSSAYNMNFQVDVTPDAEIILVMDPVGGDRIVSKGSGHLNMQYESINDVLKMFGTYTLNRGSYNFTLQDIIIKEFTIRDGSSIAFHGDPYAALLNINAIYSLNANLSDLDESFLTDKDLNRTNVPVHAVLKVSGDMRLPDISFDLEFPTLTSDTYRKVRSIVSTDDMMNRQIIYLLALNRFYTPDYMASTTKGNELVSVASSTISSQLSSILGQLSDNWSVAPTVRTDRGDFSDVEVDLALSSTLLNNRLLFNGNFGYRDKSLNDNSFIGDFDIEYLLNRSGNIRLKAYNRYNDQNYYVKTALTTQGLGVVFKRDFDNIFSFLKPLKRRFLKPTSVKHPTASGTMGLDSVTNALPDTTAVSTPQPLNGKQ